MKTKGWQQVWHRGQLPTTSYFWRTFEWDSILFSLSTLLYCKEMGRSI